MIGPVKTVAVYVESQEKAVAFYTEILGFIVRRGLPAGGGRGWVEVSPPGAESCLVLFPRAEKDDWAERKPSIVFHSPDVEATCLDLESKGVRIRIAPTAMPWGMFAVILDPDGNELGLTSQRIAPEVS
jgi:lactoylglutathione lyase